MSPRHLANRAGKPYKPKARVVDHRTLSQISNQDPTTWAIKRAIKTTINQCDWHIIPDVDQELTELDRWYDLASDAINDFSYRVDFASPLLAPELVDRVGYEVRRILRDAETSPRLRRGQLNVLFKTVKNDLLQTAHNHCAVVRRIFDKPNEHLEKSLRALQELVLEDLLVDDAGVVVKNYNMFGQLAELYTLPGYQIFPIIRPDRTVPQPPEAAYVWEEAGIVRAAFTNDELTYIMENPQGDGYGYSPVESLLHVITASLLGDKAYIDELREGALPPMIMNLGDVSETQREYFEDSLQGQIRKSDGNRIVVVSGTGTESGELQVIPVPKGVDFRQLQIREYRENLEPAIKCTAFGLSPEDVGLVRSADRDPENVAVALSDRRGILGRLDLLEAYYNAEIVKQEWPFADVKFAFVRSSVAMQDSVEAARTDSIYIAAGAMTRNEARQKLKLRPLPGGDVATLVVGNQLVQVDTLEPTEDDFDDDVFVRQDDAVLVDEEGNELEQIPLELMGTGAGDLIGQKVQGDIAQSVASVKNQQVKPNKQQPGAKRPVKSVTGNQNAPKSRKSDATRRRVENGE